MVETVVLFLPNHQHTLKMGTELSPETSETLYIVTQLSDIEHFTALIEDQVTRSPPNVSESPPGLHPE